MQHIIVHGCCTSSWPMLSTLHSLRPVLGWLGSIHSSTADTFSLVRLSSLGYGATWLIWNPSQSNEISSGDTHTCIKYYFQFLLNRPIIAEFTKQVDSPKSKLLKIVWSEFFTGCPYWIFFLFFQCKHIHIIWSLEFSLTFIPCSSVYSSSHFFTELEIKKR